MVCAKDTQGKNMKSMFPSSDDKSKGVLDIVHSDMCGSMSTTSLSRYVYYVSFIYDFSHKNWIYFLKGKDEVFSMFKNSRFLSKIFSRIR